jgi:succinyl-diaminopimelate desuccinylase
MKTDQLLETIKQLVAIESTAGNPAGLQEAYNFMIDFLLGRDKQLTIERFERNGKPSLLAYRGATRPEKFHLILNGHLDVVPGKSEQYQARLEDGKLYGRGVYDMKAAVIAMADAFCEYVDKVPFALGLQLVTDEESSGKHGTLYQLEEGVRSDFVICGECGRASDKHEIANAAKGIAIVEVTLKGRSSHGAYPWKGDNAAMRAHDFITALQERYPVPAEETAASTISVISVRTNSDAHTKTPDQAVVKLDARYTPHDPDLSTLERFEAFIHQLDPEATISHVHDFSSPLYTDPTYPQLLALKAAAEAVEGAPFNLVQRNATSDGRHYGDVGNQACEFGIAGENQHADNECITIEALEQFRATLKRFLGQSSQPAKLANQVAATVAAEAPVAA